jgi:Heparinase II/III-like protein
MRLFPVLLLALAPLAALGADADVLAQLRPGHPRLLFTDEQLAAAVAAAKDDPLRAQLHARIVALAEAELNTTPIRHVLIGPRLLDKSRTCIARVLTCSMAFRLTGDRRFLERAKKELLTAAAFDDWNPSHFLDVAEMSFAFAIGYDWLYGELTPGERATLKAAMLTHGLSFAPAAYAAGGPTDKRVAFVTFRHNWNQVCNGGLLSAALALADEEPELARLVVNGVRKSLPLVMAAYAPDGAYPEGPGYWDYGTAYNVIAIAELESALGTDFGLDQAPAFDKTALYRLYVQSPAGPAFNYADGGAGIGAQAEYTWLAARFHHPTALAHSRALLAGVLAKKVGKPDSDRFVALHAAWFPSEQPVGGAAAPLDARFRGNAELAIFRSAWNDPRALFAGFKAGRNDVNHAHLDLGSFVLDADGVRWAEDLGPDDYNLPGYFGAKRWTYYRLNNRSHNTLTPGDALQNPKAVAPIVAFSSTPERAFAVADLTAAYPGSAKRILRGLALLDRARVLVQDEVTGMKHGTPLAWRLLTGAKVTLDDERNATLTQNGHALHAEILAPADAGFTASPATPPTAAENQNAGATVLEARAVSLETETRVAVLLTPVGDHWPAAAPPPALVPLDSWR